MFVSNSKLNSNPAKFSLAYYHTSNRLPSLKANIISNCNEINHYNNIPSVGEKESDSTSLLQS